ncbi:DnaJ domain-containing protein [Desulfogranum marinum]|jgi:DnaJ like chaperone protein|uniref:DnaJ domain-containing protein n=1 Tax=Desulfogranum marinum TaxID=453220 RepID=UPI0019633602|nr:DnaJ domain-containing protein [Desulfogranum marinum]MBM9512749.1 DnaJ domain-containing protein [Desulfogranum marinum]
MEYRQHNQPGCGGCLLIIGLLLLVTGGAPALFNFLGFIFFSGLFGILLLVAAFWGFSYYVRQRVSTYESAQTESHKRFVYLLVHILVKIAQADGHFTRAELNTIIRFFQQSLRYNQDQMYWVKQLIKDARDADMSMDQLLEEFRSSFAYEPRLILLELVYQIIYTKQPPVESELETARRIAAFLQISAYDQRTFEAKYKYHQYREATSGVAADERYYGVLGLEPGADFAAIKKAYRKLSMQYHPDKVAHLGDEFKGVAEEKMKEINAAYDYFRRKFE